MRDSKHKSALVVFFGALLIIGLVLFYVWQGGVAPFTSPDPDTPLACDGDAKICPDGSSVGRVPPSCEFAACPAVGEFWGVIMGEVLLGPTCPVVSDPPDPNCADKPYATSLALTAIDGSRVLKTFSSDSEGKFYVEAPPGEYMIRSAAVANVLPYCQSQPFTLPANESADVFVSCDTGIR